MAGAHTFAGERVSAWMREHEPFVDGVTALVVLACCVSFGLIVQAPVAYALLSALLLCPLAVRRRWPAVCLAIVLGVALVQWLTVRGSIGALPADIAVPLAIAGAAGHGPPWASRLGLGAGLVGAGLGGLSWPLLSTTVPTHVLTGAFLASTVVVGWTIGALNRVRREELDALAERARLLEVGRDQRERMAALAERTRIAREVHDVVAHSLAGIIAQADGGRYAGSFEAASGALTTIGEHGRQALAETRRVLGVLRDGCDDVACGEPRQPGVQDIPDLVARVREGGLDVRLRLALPPHPVELGLSLVVYRIVQEGLTNVIKHAGAPTRADVVVRWGRRTLTVAVLDDGRGSSAPAVAGGYGMVGMRERVGARGGTVTLRPRAGGGHVLSARLPVSS